MSEILSDISRTFDEFLLLPGLTKKEHVSANVSLKTPIAKLKKGEKSRLYLKIPVCSAAMQAVSGSNLAISLARRGGISFIFCSQSITEQAEMIKRVKEHKAGFVESDANLAPTATLGDAVALRKKTGHSTIPITADGGKKSQLVGLLTSKDFWEFKDDLTSPVKSHYTPVERLVLAHEGISLQEATELLWKNKKECLPIVDSQGNLTSLVFRRDYFDHKSNPDELSDDNKRLIVGAALNTHDYQERAQAVINAGADVLCFDSSDGYSEWQRDAVKYIHKEFGENVIVGGGNVVSRDGFNYLVEEAGVDFVKVGIGGGSICITRGQKGIGRGQASAVMEVAKARDEYFLKTGNYIPICSDGGIYQDSHITMALAMGANFVMMGRYFATTDESEGEKVNHGGRLYKAYWAEGSNRARNWQRYQQADTKLIFEEGVDAYVPYSGRLIDKLNVSIAKLKSTMCNIGSLNIEELHEKARLLRVSEMTLIESSTSRVEQFEHYLRSE
jgi:IMP dehydrogenase